MDTMLTVAIVTGAVSLVAAIISSIVALVSIRRNTQASKEIETYRHQLELERESQVISRHLIEKRIEILGKTCSLIQFIRDDVRALKNKTSKEKEILERISKRSIELLILYGDSHYALDPLDRATMHDTKYYCSGIEEQAQDYVKSRKKAGGKVSWELIESSLDTLATVQTYFIHEHEKLTAVLAQLPEPLVFAKDEYEYQPILPFFGAGAIEEKSRIKKDSGLGKSKAG